MRSLEWMNGILRRAGIDPETGRKVNETWDELVLRAMRESERALIQHIVNEDMRDNWPRIEKEEHHGKISRHTHAGNTPQPSRT